jgi:hypothetical protein
LSRGARLAPDSQEAPGFVASGPGTLRAQQQQQQLDEQYRMQQMEGQQNLMENQRMQENFDRQMYSPYRSTMPSPYGQDDDE